MDSQEVGTTHVNVLACKKPEGAQGERDGEHWRGHKVPHMQNFKGLDKEWQFIQYAKEGNREVVHRNII